MSLLPRPHLRRPKPLARPAPVHCTLQAVCDSHTVSKVRSLRLCEFAGTGTRLDCLHAIAPDGNAKVLMQVTFVPDGPAAAALERLVVQLAREPGVHEVHWHLHTDNTSPAAPSRLRNEKTPASRDQHGSLTGNTLRRGAGHR